MDRHRYFDGLEVALGVLSELTQEEMSHITGVYHRLQGPVSEQAFLDCVRTVKAEREASAVSTTDDLLAYQNKLRERKGIKS